MRLTGASTLFGALALVFISSSTLVSASGSYVVLFPGVLHPGWPLNVAVSVHRTERPGATVFIEGTLARKDGVVVTRTDTSMAGGESKLLSIPVPSSLPEDNHLYYLTVSGTGGLQFTQSESVRYNANASLLLVQTDKNIYKPGQLVRFRIINVNKDLAPVHTPLTVFILNHKGNKLERYSDIALVNGVGSQEFQLSNYSSLGTWHIELQDLKEEVLYSHAFQVDEYVLPKFSVEVNPDPDFLIWGIYDQPPGIIITSMYTYGKAVQGECVLNLGQMGSNNRQKMSQKIPESGVVEFTDINWDYLIGAKPNNKKTLLAQVEVKDIMGKTEYGEATIDIFRDRYKVEILPQSPDVIHNGLETEFFVKVSDHYDVPAAGKEADVTLRMPDMSPVTVRVVMEEGKPFASLKFTPFWWRQGTLDNSGTYYGNLEGDLIAKLVGDSEIQASKQVYWYYSIDLQSIKFEGPKHISIPRGDPHTFKIKKTQTSMTSSTMYTIVSQGTILETGMLSGNELTVTPTFDMCPSAKVIVYQLFELAKVTADGYREEVVADSVELSPTLCMDKQVKVRFDARQQRTGTEANLQINVEMKDGSAIPKQVHDVFYLAVDKSIVLLQGDTSMTDDKIMNSLDSTNSWTREVTQNTAQSVFSNVNLGHITSATLIKVGPEPGIAFDMAAGAGDREMMRRKNENGGKTDAKDDKDTAQPIPAKKIRKNFPDTWLWNHGKTTENGQFRASVGKLPDTITSWHVTAFGINENGIVGSGTPFELTAFNPFFVSLNLPYSIKKGEVFSLRVTVFNYRLQEVTSIIRLEMSDDFVITGGQRKDNYMEHAVNLLPNLASVVIYEINASSIGKIKFHVVAQDVEDVSQRDELEKELIVKPPGEERDQVISDMLLLVEDSSVTRLFEVDWPYDEIIEGSQRLQFKVTGQVLGQSLANLNNLVRQPTGCGEQNMIGLVPNIYGATYIEQTDQKQEQALVDDMIKNMITGYRRQVDLYRKDDGSYSAWATDKIGSTWLTAFVMKSFAAASKFIQVDTSVLQSAISFMNLKQRSNGYFREDGRLLHEDLQTGTSEDLPLTVYCLLSILETAEVMPTSELDMLLDRTIPQITRQTSDIASQQSAFLPAMTAYTLSLAAKRNPVLQLDQQIDTLMQAAQGTSAPWESQDSSAVPLISSSQKSPTALMTAAYVLLTHLKRNDMSKAFTVMKWLQAQQNRKGGFGSTQDTVLVLQSLAEFGIFYKNVDATGQVEVTVPGTDFRDTLDISGGRSILLQQSDLPIVKGANIVNVTLLGKTNTVAFVKVVSFYNTPVNEKKKVDSSSKSGAVDIRTSSRYLSPSDHEVEACVYSSLEPGYGMYVSTWNLASGEEPSYSPTTMKEMNPGVSQVEVEDGVIHFYMNDIPKDGLCLKTVLQNQMDFAVKQSGSAKVYSYYEPEYIKESELAVVDEMNKCQGGDCGSAPGLPVASFILTVVICFMTSLLACL